MQVWWSHILLHGPFGAKRKLLIITTITGHERSLKTHIVQHNKKNTSLFDSDNP